MYNGIGLQTARGSGTNGHVQRNYAFLRPGKKDNITYKTEEDLSKLDAAMSRQPNQGILDHERKRKIEVKCAEFEEILEKEGFTEEEIQVKINSYRSKLMGQGKNELPKDEFGRISVRETHQIAEAQQEKNAKLREAFGISEYFVEGSSFDPDRKAKEDLAKSSDLQQKLQAQAEIEKETSRKYGLVRTPSKEKEVNANVNKTKAVNSEKKKKKKKNRDGSSSPERKKDKKSKKSKKHKKERSKKKKSRKHKASESDSSESASDSDNESSNSEKEAKRQKKSKKEKKKKDKKKKQRDAEEQSRSSSRDVRRQQSPSSRRRKTSDKKLTTPITNNPENNNERGRSRERRDTVNKNRDATKRSKMENSNAKKNKDRDSSKNCNEKIDRSQKKARSHSRKRNKSQSPLSHNAVSPKRSRKDRSHTPKNSRSNRHEGKQSRSNSKSRNKSKSRNRSMKSRDSPSNRDISPYKKCSDYQQPEKPSLKRSKKSRSVSKQRLIIRNDPSSVKSPRKRSPSPPRRRKSKSRSTSVSHGRKRYASPSNESKRRHRSISADPKSSENRRSRSLSTKKLSRQKRTPSDERTYRDKSPSNYRRNRQQNIPTKKQIKVASDVQKERERENDRNRNPSAKDIQTSKKDHINPFRQKGSRDRVSDTGSRSGSSYREGKRYSRSPMHYKSAIKNTAIRRDRSRTPRPLKTNNYRSRPRKSASPQRRRSNSRGRSRRRSNSRDRSRRRTNSRGHSIPSDRRMEKDRSRSSPNRTIKNSRRDASKSPSKEERIYKREDFLKSPIRHNLTPRRDSFESPIVRNRSVHREDLMKSPIRHERSPRKEEVYKNFFRYLRSDRNSKVSPNAKQSASPQRKINQYESPKDLKRSSSQSSVSSDLSYSPARRNPERYRDIIEQVEREKKLKQKKISPTKKFERSPSSIPPPRQSSKRSRSQSKDKNNKKSCPIQQQPVVRLHSSTDSEDNDENGYNEERERIVEKYVEAVVDDKTQEQNLKEMKMLEALKSGLAAKAKEKIKTIEKRASEVSPNQEFIRTNTFNIFMTTNNASTKAINPVTDNNKVLSSININIDGERERSPKFISNNFPNNIEPNTKINSTITEIIANKESISNEIKSDSTNTNTATINNNPNTNPQPQKQRIVIKPFKINDPMASSLPSVNDSSTVAAAIGSTTLVIPGLSAPSTIEFSGVMNGAPTIPNQSSISDEKVPSRSRSRSKPLSNRENVKSRNGSRSSRYSSSSSGTSGSSRSRSGSSGSSSRSSRSSRSSSASSRHTHSRSRSASRSPSIPRRRGSPSFLDRRRITSARKRPIPYHRPTPSSVSSLSSNYSRGSTPESPVRSISLSRSPAPHIF